MRILIATVPAAGHFNPLTGPAVRLAELGHDVRWYAGPNTPRGWSDSGSRSSPTTKRSRSPPTTSTCSSPIVRSSRARRRSNSTRRSSSPARPRALPRHP